MGGGEGLVAAVDVGTTNIRCHLYDKNGRNQGTGTRQIELLYPAEGLVEMDPDVLWDQFVAVVKDAMQDCGCDASQLACLGITTQRNTFITLDKSAETCKSWNNSWTFSAMHGGSKVLYWLTGNKRYLAGSIYRLVNAMVTPRLLKVIDSHPTLKQKIAEDEVIYACIETYLLWKLTGSVCTEVSLASATGMFDPFVMDWGRDILRTVRMPLNILPVVLDTCSDPGIFGAPVPITALAADQQAALFGCCGFTQGSVKISLSTGTFVDINTGLKPHASMKGLIPGVGWRLKDGDLSYIAEGFSHDTATAINWAQSIGLFDKVEDTSSIAESVSSTGGVYFVPAFAGLQVRFIPHWSWDEG